MLIHHGKSIDIHQSIHRYPSVNPSIHHFLVHINKPPIISSTDRVSAAPGLGLAGRQHRPKGALRPTAVEDAMADFEKS